MRRLHQGPRVLVRAGSRLTARASKRSPALRAGRGLEAARTSRHNGKPRQDHPYVSRSTLNDLRLRSQRLAHPATRVPPPATRHPPPATRHPRTPSALGVRIPLRLTRWAAHLHPSPPQQLLQSSGIAAAPPKLSASAPRGPSDVGQADADRVALHAGRLRQLYRTRRGRAARCAASLDGQARQMRRQASVEVGGEARLAADLGEVVGAHAQQP